LQQNQELCSFRPFVFIKSLLYASSRLWEFSSEQNQNFPACGRRPAVIRHLKDTELMVRGAMEKNGREG
jgi:hypothetical protein